MMKKVVLVTLMDKVHKEKKDESSIGAVYNFSSEFEKNIYIVFKSMNNDKTYSFLICIEKKIVLVTLMDK